MIDLDSRRGQLLARKEELTVRLREIDAELDAHQSKDWEELATEREGDEVLEGMGASGKAEIAMINAALERISEGEYGFCAVCGEEISEKRLDVLPYTPVCKDCAARNAARS
ncbi:TraR/DksA family transcriptional regulator [Celeribacter litoreus]|uniref:TraR/DksA family transcriptional regulator n=1 Tax=Celeribacter litoreus TaxID=2876714 RepID=UPI001CCA2D13|nr:TraR/DksA C4-type zinc finger protein [Celeribacter litoreus]MCA0043549.1 TraR/DksA C4-type zinc finger protein [Celeribacter litoreus]